MKPANFQYVRPTSLAEALELLAMEDMDVAALAGGQSLIPMMNFRVARPEVLVDLNPLDELRCLDLDGEPVQVGAMTRYAELEASADLAERLPLVASALPHIAHVAIRNRGTLGGSLALADPAAEMPAIMLALGATFTVASLAGERKVSADDFFLGTYETCLERGELVAAIEAPAARPCDGFGFCEIARRHGDYAMAGVAVAAREGVPRVALFAVSGRPVRATAAEAILSEDPTAIEPATEALDDIEFSGDQNGGKAMKRHLARVVLRRAWTDISP